MRLLSITILLFLLSFGFAGQTPAMPQEQAADKKFSMPAPQQNAPQLPMSAAVWLLGSGIAGFATIRLRSR